ncbi:hypothetical protein ACLKA6_013741 [Drosophila palustris]
MPGSSRVVVLLDSLGSDRDPSLESWPLRLLPELVRRAPARLVCPSYWCAYVCVCDGYSRDTWNRSCVREDCRDESCDREDVFPLDSLSRRPLKLVLATARRIRRSCVRRSYVPGPGFTPRTH